MSIVDCRERTHVATIVHLVGNRQYWCICQQRHQTDGLFTGTPTKNNETEHATQTPTPTRMEKVINHAIYNGGMIYFMSDLSSKESDHRAFALRPSCY